MKPAEIYESVTARILAELEQGAAPWLKPWKGGRGTGVGLMPTNGATGRSYSGINIPILWDAAHRHGYPTHAWMTFRQAHELDARVRNGERGSTVFFTKIHTPGSDEDAEPEARRRRAFLRAYTVFNSAQIDGLPETAQPKPDSRPPAARRQGAVRFVAGTGADIRHGGDVACFVPSQDFIQLPPMQAFRDPESYYATVLHELGHWSGHTTRLDRNLSGRFGTQSYAAEELIAELTAAFLCATLGITGELRHAGCIANWITLLRTDNRAIFTAASKASQAADYLRSFSERPDA